MMALLRYFWKICKKNKIAFIFLVLSAVILGICRLSEFVAEYVFARGVFKLISVPLGFITGWLPFSIAEILLIVLIFLGIVFIIYLAVSFIKAAIKQDFSRAKSFAGVVFRRLFLVLTSILLAFCLLCGTNYYRYDFEKFCGFTVSEYTKDDLYELCVYLAEQTTKARADITSVDEAGTMKLSGDFRETSKKASKAMRKLSEEYSSLMYISGMAKPVLLSKYMSYTNIVGIYFPFTMESNVNYDISDFDIPATICHELAHLSGYMKENEANYIAYLACTRSGDPELIYSGYMLAYTYATNELYDSDSEMYYKVRELLSEDVLKDMYADYEYWKAYEESEAGQVISSVSNTINDNYLVINGQEDGVESYNRMVTLLIAEYQNR